jgi:tRNA nucleotidyltransferase (CCA-adding enzyme)
MSDPAESLDCYLVGGAVRDELLGLPVVDRDWVVVGATASRMTELGFRPVGRDFPVFLHPQSAEQYALARTERKTAPGHHGFAVDASPDITLEQDLARRDLTINAMAKTPVGELIDPFQGQRDLQDRCLRHVSDAFSEDPLRVLRVARFAARLKPLEFEVAGETLALMAKLAASGELDTLVAERVWTELSRALAEPAPGAFVATLRDCNALKAVFPEIDALFGVPQPLQYHPEGDSGLHTLMVLEAAAALSPDTRVRFAALVHDLGKGTTPKDQLPRHIGHETRGIALVEALCERVRVPARHRRLALVVCRHHLAMHRLSRLKPGTILRLLNDLNAFRDDEAVALFALACEADARGRGGASGIDYPQRVNLMRFADAARSVSLSDLSSTPLSGPERAKVVEERRLKAIADVVREIRADSG